MAIQTKILTGASIVALVAANAVVAQTTADVAGGQVIVEQEDATVNVTVPGPMSK